jgi:predicted Ser/Thr protein kinase
MSTKRMNDAEFVLFCAVARFYDAKGYVEYDKSQGRKVSRFKCIGTEAQQIQTRLYFDFLKESMIKECEKVMAGEAVLAELLGQEFSKSGFKSNFYKAFAAKVRERLYEMKEDREDHEHKEYTAIEVAKIRFGSRRSASASGMGAQIGSNVGSNVSLNKQASGSQRLALAGR